ncbi:MAG: carboxyl-terminal processing protease [Oceanospirillaceae bacterium]|jgi:carboxyl-terminal processing protease
MHIKLNQLTPQAQLRRHFVRLILVLALSTITYANTMAAVPTPQAPVPLAALQSFVAVYERIRLQHVEAKTDEELLQLALEGLILKLDPFSSYLDTEDMARLQEDTRGEYSGIGVELVPEGTYIRVITPIDNSPAYRAGILPGDWITHVQGTAVKGLDLHAIDQLMTGGTGTKVTLSILRNGEELQFSLTREIITTQSVRSELMAGNVAYLRISRFQDHTGQDLAEQMNALKLAGADRWLLDLRNNPGGTLDAAAQVADAFLTKGTIVTTKARQTHGNMRFDAHITDPSEGWPLVILINNGSASASEIVAGAIKDHQRGQLIGDTSFGKGSVQSIITLPQGTGVKLTTAYYYTPDGHNIHLKGIEPNVKISNTSAEPDLQLAAALDLLNPLDTHNNK